MSKMNIEVMEQLLKNLAANVGYDLIPNPFDTPFEEAGLKVLPDDKQFIWPVPVNVLVDDAHKDFRKMWIDSDLINTVVELSWAWPHSEDEQMAILMIDITRPHRGTVKFVDATEFDLSNCALMDGVCNMIIHDQYPGEYSLAFDVDGDTKDLWLDNPWNEFVCVIPARDIDSFLPSDYIVKPSVFIKGKHELLGELFDITYLSEMKNGLKSPAIVISTRGKLDPMIIKLSDNPINISLKDKIILTPYKDYINLDYVMEQLSKEEVIRQLPIYRRISVNDIFRVNIEACDQLYLLSKEERQRIAALEVEKLFSSLKQETLNGKEA